VIKLFSYSQILNKDETLSLTRKQAVNYVDGKPTYGPPLELFVIANVQPVAGRDLLLVPEHDRFSEQYWLYFRNPNWVRNKGIEYTSQSYILVNDIIHRLGKNFQVQTVENWGSYCRARMQILDVGPNATP
jgi:hypothetical protein